MHSALWAAKTGLDAQHQNLAIISNNLANVNTVGFKKSRPEFEDLMYENITQPGSQTTQDTQNISGLMLGTGTKLVATKKIFTDGSQIQTNNALDIAIQGRGFLKILLPTSSDEAYTRAGNLQIDATGQLVTSSGYVVQPPVTVPQGTIKITISSDGIVSALDSSGGTPSQIGTIELVDFLNPAGLQPIGENLFKETQSSGTPQTGTPGQNGLGTIVQGALEASNVSVVEELVDLIEAQRAFEVNSRVISTVDQTLEYANQQL